MKTFVIALNLVLFTLFCSNCIFDSDEEEEEKPLPEQPAATKIDISAYVDPNDSLGYAYSDRIAVIDERAYVLVQRLDDYIPTMKGKVVIINTSTDEIERILDLNYSNPAWIEYRNGDLYICCMGSMFATGDGSIERVNLSDYAVTTVVTETQLDPSCAGILSTAAKNDSVFYCTVYLGWGNTQVWTINMKSGTMVKKLSGITDAFGGIVYSQEDNKLFVGERGTGSEGVLVFNGTTDELSAGPISVGLAPNTMDLYTSGSTRKLVVTTSDYQSGAVRILNCSDNTLADTDIAVFQDNRVRVIGSKVFVLERYETSNLVTVDISGGGVILTQESLGTAVNPADIARAASGKYYISIANSDYIIIKEM